MNQWQKIEEAVAAAAEMPEADFDAWLDAFCGADAELKIEIRSLLVFERDAENFLEKSAGEYAAQILPEANEDFTGKIFGKYKILSELGRGGMGAVFLAERIDGEFSQVAALKIVRQTFIEKELVAHFKRERQILATLNHPHIARLLDGGVSAHGEPFLVMEFIRGETLLKFAGAQNLALRSRLKLFLKICRAVAFAHRNLIVHRDIKPSNILVTADGEPKLLDFGLAKVLDDSIADENQTRTNFRALTPAYASPEQINGEIVTTATDIYSLGKVLAELVENSPDGEISNRQPKTERQSPNAKVRASNNDIQAILQTAMREEPERRYRSVEAFAEDIENFLDGKPVKARPNTRRYRATKFIRRHKTAAAALILILLATFGGLAASLWQARNAREQRDLANAQKLKAEQVSQFLSAALAYSDPSAAIPGTTNHRDATINQMLDEFAPRIEIELAGQPDVQASLQRTVGYAYISQNRPADAEKYLTAALETQRWIFGENHRETAHTLAGLAQVREMNADYAGSLPILRTVIEIYQKQPPADPLHTRIYVNSLITLGNNLWTQGNYAAADSFYGDALLFASRLQGRDRELVADAKTGLGINRFALGGLDEATALLREAVAEYRSLPHTRYKLPIALNHLSQVLLWKNELDEALSLLRECAAVSLEVWGESNYNYARSHWLMIYALCFKGECAAAENSLRKIEDLASRFFGSNKIIAANNSDARNVFLTRTGRLAEGEKAGRAAVELYTVSTSRGSNSTTLARINLADNLILQKKYAEAEQVLLAAYQDSSEIQGVDQWRTRQTAEKLASLFEITGKPELAQKYR